MESIEKDLKDYIREYGNKFEGNDELNAYEKMNDDFKALVKSGVIEKRGNQLLSIAETHLKSQVWFNTKESS